MTNTSYAVEIVDATKTFGLNAAVSNLTLTVPRESIYGFIGPNGSGKTTTIRMIMGILLPDRGDISVLGQLVRCASNKDVGYLPEERGLYRKMKVRDLLLFYGGLKAGRPVGAEVDLWLERFGLKDCANSKLEGLSKGMSQKVQFIAAVVADPELIVLDEPFSGLDPVNLDMLREVILDLNRNGKTIILSTHDMNIAETMSDHIFMICNGRKVLDGTLGAIRESYGQDTVRVELEDNSASTDNLPGVEKVQNRGNLKVLNLAAGADSQQIVAELMRRTPVRRFETARPSLHDIFIRIVKPGPGEVQSV